MELRKDYNLERWVYYSPSRGKRPKEFAKNSEIKSTACFFCPGNESMTPPEIGKIGEPWTLRWFDNKFAAVTEEGKTKKEKLPFLHTSAFGKHEVIVETARHDIQSWELDEESIRKLLEVYRNRITELEKRKKISYVSVFKNHGVEGGTSILHSHSQLIATALIPPLIKEEIKATTRKGACSFCSVIIKEEKSARLCFANATFISFAPYASRFHYETWIFSRRHIGKMEELSDAELKDLAEILAKTLHKLKELSIDYNYFIHYSPKKEKLHFHIEVTPRDSTWAGFELSSNAIINSVMPEEAAEYYRKTEVFNEKMIDKGQDQKQEVSDK